MSGFYVNHLKSISAQRIAPILEQRFANPTEPSGDGMSVISFHTQTYGSSDDYLSAAYAVIRDHPEFFYYEMNIQATVIGNHVLLKMPLLYSLAEIKSCKFRLEHAINLITAKAKTYSSMWDRERYIFEYLQTHTDYNESDFSHENYNIIGPLLLKKGVCEGISKAFAVLCHRVGIPCIVVFDDKHMWNMVNVGGEFAHVDATWGAKNGSICDYSYFNVSDREISLDHGKEINCVPICSGDNLSFYYKQGTLFNSSTELKKYLIKHLAFSRNILNVKLKNGNIEQAINEAAQLLPFSFKYVYNPKLNTAIINI